MMKKGEVMKTGRILWTLIVFCSLLLLYGCGKEKKEGPLTAQQYIEQGWVKFSAGDDAGASGDFNAAIGLDTSAHDAYFGLGWAELRQSHAGLAVDAFATYLLKEPNASNAIDAKAGLALAYHANKKFQEAIDPANSVLSSAPSWSFSGDSRINHLDLALVLAESYYAIANFSQSLAMVNLYFDPSFTADLTTSEGRAKLAAKLQDLYTG
jgi:tetratricopeptide (TPR) repeat protein